MLLHRNRTARAAALLALVTLACAGAARPAAADDTVRTWSLAASGADAVALRIKYERSSAGSTRMYQNTNTVPLSTLHGLSAADVAGATVRRRFETTHDAGKLVFEGTVGNGRGSGTYDVEADPSFQRELARRGIRPATNDELLELALADFKLATLDAALASGFERPTPEDLLTVINRGITADYLRGFKGVPLEPKTLRALAQLRDHGVTGEYVRSFADAGYRPISVDDLTLARDHGVDARRAAAIHAAMPSLTMKSLALFADHGVRPELVRALGDRHAAISDRDVATLADHGVPGEYVTGLDRLGLHPSVADMVRLHDYGVSLAFMQRLHDHGYTSLSTDDIIKLAQHGI